MRCALAAIVLAGAAFAPSALAQAPRAQMSFDQCGVHARAMHERGWPGGTAALMRASTAAELSPERVEARLVALHAELAITRAQERRWADFAQALRSDAGEMQAMMRAQGGSAAPSASLPERLRQRHVLMQRRLHALGRIEHAVGRLYAVLSASQRARAERALEPLAC
ncbi:MAG: hypothetical protein BroJett013_25200 [Alphaproteobacteria bacterium]|nr:MAG: hypothetical protein BroJett013_25200 [Alphaproteobacteria bacterium]